MFKKISFNVLTFYSKVTRCLVCICLGCNFTSIFQLGSINDKPPLLSFFNDLDPLVVGWKMIRNKIIQFPGHKNICWLVLCIIILPQLLYLLEIISVIIMVELFTQIRFIYLLPSGMISTPSLNHLTSASSSSTSNLNSTLSSSTQFLPSSWLVNLWGYSERYQNS